MPKKKPESEKPQSKPKGRPKSDKKKVQWGAMKLDPEFLAYLQAAAYWARTSVTKIMEEGAKLYLKQLEEKHNNGKKFPPKPEDEG